MEYFVAQEGEKIGPLSGIRVIELIRRGTITADSLIWRKGLADWIPLHAEPSLSAFLPPSPVADKAPADPMPTARSPRVVRVRHEVRPLLRFWARSFDYTLVMAAIACFSNFEIFEVQGGITLEEWKTRVGRSVETGELASLAQMAFYAMLIWHVIEGLLLHLFKTTPGKALFGITVTAAGGERVSIIFGICRAFLVYILGVALLHIPLLVGIALSFSFFRIMATGSTFWDEILHLEVAHPPLTVIRLLVAIGAFVLLMVL